MTRKEVTRSKGNIAGNIWFNFRRMTSNLIRVKDAGAYKLGMPQIRSRVAKGSEIEVGGDGEVRLVEE